MPKISLLLFVLFTSSLFYAQTTKFVRGRIIDQKTEQAVEEADITLQNVQSKKSYTVETTEEGNFEFKNIPFGMYNLKMTDKDYQNKKSYCKTDYQPKTNY